MEGSYGAMGEEQRVEGVAVGGLVVGDVIDEARETVGAS
jgi:hypothetical protein